MPATVAPRPSAEDRIRAALWFAERKFGIFTAWSATEAGICRCPKGRECENAAKHPIGHQGFKEHTRDPERIRTLLSAGSEPNYGLVCPDGVFVLDVDGDGVARLADLEAEYGPLPPTLRTNTAHGQHVFLRWPDDLPRPIGQLFGYVTRWGSGANAGYVIGPRSIHASGAVYEPAGTFLDIAELPAAWAAGVLTPAVDAAGSIAITAGGYELPEAGYRGSRYDAIRDFAASRYMRGIPKDEILNSVIHSLAPRFAEALTEDDIRARFERAWKNTPERLGPPMAGLEDVVVPAAVREAPPPVTAVALWPAPPDAAAFHGPAGDVVQAVADATEADPVGILGSLLAAIGACMGHYRYLYQGGAQSTNLFVVLVGDSSHGRKGTASGIAREVMTAAYPTWNDLIVAGLGSGEGLVTYLGGKDGKEEHRALVVESELARLLTAMARDGSALSPMLRDAWDGVPMGRVLAREAKIVKFHHVGVLAHITPVELRARLTTTDAANGFGNRFMWLSVRRTRLLPHSTSPLKLVPAHLLSRINDAIVAALKPGELRWSEAARVAWEDFYLETAMRDAPGLFGSMVARAEAQVCRLALLYALLDGSSVIEIEHLTAARALWAYAERSVEYTFGRSTGSADADALLGYLVDGPLPWEKAKDAIGTRRAAVLDDAISVLGRLGLAEIVTVPRSGGGRPARWVRQPGQTVQTVQTALGTAHGGDA